MMKIGPQGEGTCLLLASDANREQWPRAMASMRSHGGRDHGQPPRGAHALDRTGRWQKAGCILKGPGRQGKWQVLGIQG